MPPPTPGQKKGGKSFPRIALAEAVEYSRKLVSKTFNAAQPRAIIFKGVFNNVGSVGEMRAAALRQYALMSGGNDALAASDLAKAVAAATPEDLPKLLRQACLSPKIFRTLYDTFQSDTVSSAKVRQQAIQVGVHPDNADQCTDLFVASLVSAGLARAVGDQFEILTLSAATLANSMPARLESEPETPATEEQEPEVPDALPAAPAAAPSASADIAPPPSGNASARSVIHVNINLDSSLDTDKLQKQLELLRRYGAL